MISVKNDYSEFSYYKKIFLSIFEKNKSEVTFQAKAHWVMRVSLGLCFIGHGAWGVITKSSWLPFFVSQGIPVDVAWNLQRPIGLFDIALGIYFIWKPRRIILIWMFFWTLWTAMLRPLAANLKAVQDQIGQWSVVLDTSSLNVAKMQTWEFWERAGNWGPPFILLIMSGSFFMNKKDLFLEYKEPELSEDKLDLIFWICRFLVASLLIGHAGIGFAAHSGNLIGHWKSLGFAADANFISIIGYFEFVLGILVFFFPLKSIIYFVLIWKVFTEFLYVPANTVAGAGFLNIFEWIERWGDYGIPVLMLILLERKKYLSVLKLKKS